MDKYVVAPPAGSTQNSVGAEDGKWQKGYFEKLPNWQEYLAESTGYGIVSGCEPTISGLTVTVASGIVHLADGTRKEIAETNITLEGADPSNPRIDLVYITRYGTVAKITGTAAASPSAPAVPSGGISVAQVSVAAGATTGIVTDKRDMLARFYNTGIVNVKDFGAVGDGTHDDTAAIQSAIDTNKTTIYFPAGTYMISRSLALKDGQECVVIKGDGPSSIIKKAGDYNEGQFWDNGRYGIDFYIFMTAYVDYLYLEDITIDGNTESFTRYQYKISGDAATVGGLTQLNTNYNFKLLLGSPHKQLSIKNCVFQNIHAEEFLLCVSPRTIIDNLTCKNMQGTAIHVWGRENELVVTNSKFENINLFPDEYYVGDTKYYFANNSTNKHGMQFGDAVDFCGKTCFVTNCTFENVARCCLANDQNVAAQNYTQNDVVFANNAVLYDSEKLVNTNPFAAVWSEQGLNTIIANNTVKYLMVGAENLINAAFRIAAQQEDSNTLISNNIIDATDYTNYEEEAILLTVLPNGMSTIKGNCIKGKFKRPISISTSQASMKMVNISENQVYQTAITGVTSQGVHFIGQSPYSIEKVKITNNTISSDGCVTGNDNTTKSIATNNTPYIEELSISNNYFDAGMGIENILPGTGYTIITGNKIKTGNVCLGWDRRVVIYGNDMENSDMFLRCNNDIVSHVSNNTIGNLYTQKTRNLVISDNVIKYFTVIDDAENTIVDNNNFIIQEGDVKDTVMEIYSNKTYNKLIINNNLAVNSRTRGVYILKGESTSGVTASNNVLIGNSL